MAFTEIRAAKSGGICDLKFACHQIAEACDRVDWAFPSSSVKDAAYDLARDAAGLYTLAEQQPALVRAEIVRIAKCSLQSLICQIGMPQAWGYANPRSEAVRQLYEAWELLELVPGVGAVACQTLEKIPAAYLKPRWQKKR